MAAACRISCTVDKCEKTEVSVASNFLRIGSSIDCTIYSYSGSNLPILYGDNRNIILGPHNVAYSSLLTLIEKAEIPVESSYVKNFSKPILAKEDKTCFSLLEESEFFKLAMPKSFEDAKLQLTPQNYLEAIIKRMKMFTEVQEKISDAKLNSEEEKMLHVAIQGYFREWLVANNHHKRVNELVKLIDQ